MLGLYNDAESMFAQAAPIGAKYPPLQLSLLRARANLALSRNQYGHAMALARLALAGGTASPGTKAELNSIVGLALLGSGQKQAGLRACEEALRTAESLNDDEVLMQTRLALVKAKLESGDRPGALAVFHQAESNLSRFPEWRWRALALMARTDSLYLTPARRALDQLTEQWGSNVIRPYLERPDIKPLARPFLSSFHAEH
jgi:tetratricopeptide (TPR) repeat protein